MNAMARRARVIRFPNSARPRSEETDGLVEVRRCRDQSEALVVRALLESEGIPVVLRSNQAQSVYPFSVGEQAVVVVLTTAPEAPHARAVLARQSATDAE